MGYGILAKEIMTRRPITVSENSSVYNAAKKMLLNGVGSILVVDGKKNLKGIITESTIIENVILKGLDPKRVKVNKIMKKKVIVGSEEDDIFDIIQKMRKYNIRRVPITKNGILKGMVTQKDIIAVAPSLIDMLFEISKVREPSFKLSIRNSERSGVCDICGNFSNHLKFINGKWVCESCREMIYGRS